MVTGAAFSPDGKSIVTATRDTIARIWDAATETERLRLVGHENSITSIAFAPDGKSIVTASEDETARVWDAATGMEILRLQGHESWVTSAAYSPEGNRIITASRDGTARIWDAATGQGLLHLKGHEYWITSAAFSQDGKSVVTASQDKTVRVWNISSLPKGSILDVACALLPMIDGKRDTSLEGLGKEYGLKLDEPICEGFPERRPLIPVLPFRDGEATLTEPTPWPK